MAYPKANLKGNSDEILLISDHSVCSIHRIHFRLYGIYSGFCLNAFWLALLVSQLHQIQWVCCRLLRLCWSL